MSYQVVKKRRETVKIPSAEQQLEVLCGEESQGNAPVTKAEALVEAIEYLM